MNRNCPICKERLTRSMIKSSDNIMAKTFEILREDTRTSSSTLDEDTRELACYDLQCRICDYEWRTRYARIPAQCPACRSSMYGTGNYLIQREVYYTDKPIPGTKEYGQEIGALAGGILIIVISFFFFFSFGLASLLMTGIGVIVVLEKARKLGFI